MDISKIAMHKRIRPAVSLPCFQDTQFFVIMSATGITIEDNNLLHKTAWKHSKGALNLVLFDHVFSLTTPLRHPTMYKAAQKVQGPQ